MEDKIFAVIPARNEEKHIYNIVKETKKFVENVVVVDDGSKDKTVELAKKANAVVLKHMVNLGKGAALKTGCDYAINNNADIIIVMDADAQHDPKDIPKFLQKIKTHDIILSYRKSSKNMPLILQFGNWFIDKTIKFLYGMRIRDSQCGYRTFTSSAYKKLRWDASDYSMESEMISKIGKHKLSYSEIPIETIYPDRYKGTTILDGVKIVVNLFLWKFNNI